MSLTKDDIMSSQSKRVHHIKTPEWGGEVCIRQLLGKELAEATNIIEGRSKGDGTEDENAARLCVLFLSDEEGNRLFNESDIPALLEKPLAPLLRCMMVGLDVNGMSNEAQDRIRAEIEHDPFVVTGSGSQGNGAVRPPKRKSKRRSESS